MLDILIMDFIFVNPVLLNVRHVFHLSIVLHVKTAIFFRLIHCAMPVVLKDSISIVSLSLVKDVHTIAKVVTIMVSVFLVMKHMTIECCHLVRKDVQQ